MDKPKTIAEAWTVYREIVVHPDAGPKQVESTRRAFYQGARSILLLADAGVHVRCFIDEINAFDAALFLDEHLHVHRN